MAARSVRNATCTTPSGSQAPLPCASLCAGTPKRINPGMPSETRRLASATRESRECWTSPGMEAIGTGDAAPSRTKSGATKSSTSRRASATKRRKAGVRRNRRRRRVGKASVIGSMLRGVVRAVAEVVDQRAHHAFG